LQNPSVTRNIAFNYILADHDDNEVVNFNRAMLPAYYGLLRMCCLQSRSFTRSLAQHQNIQWAFKNITPFATQYHVACEELFKLMALFVQRHPDSTEEELAEIRNFRHHTLQTYLTVLDGRSAWAALIQVLRILVENDDDRLFVVYHNGLSQIFDALVTLHSMYHEATACHVATELVELISIFQSLLKAVHVLRNTTSAEVMQVLSRWKDMPETASRLLTLVNTYTPPEMRDTCVVTVREMLLLWPSEMLNILVPLLHRAHSSSAGGGGAGEGTSTGGAAYGPFFPRRGLSAASLSGSLKGVRPPRPMLQMSFPSSAFEASHGTDPDYDRSLQRFFHHYHNMVDLMVRLAVNELNEVSDEVISEPSLSLCKMLVELSAMVGYDGVPMHNILFPKLWLDIHNTEVRHCRMLKKIKFLHVIYFCRGSTESSSRC